MAQLATHAGTRLEDDTASAALHAHGEHQATQLVTDADRVVDAVCRGTR